MTEQAGRRPDIVNLVLISLALPIQAQIGRRKLKTFVRLISDPTTAEYNIKKANSN